jgi:hypothetical protein
MKIVGVVMAVFGWLLPVVALGMTTSTGARLVICLIGIAISVVGITRVLNKAHQKHAIWKV